jgi:hypothetical protein
MIGGSGGIDYLRELQRGARETIPGPAYQELFAAVQAVTSSPRIVGAGRPWVAPPTHCLLVSQVVSSDGGARLSAELDLRCCHRKGEVEAVGRTSGSGPTETS